MLRRDVLRVLSAAAVAPVLPQEVTFLLQQAQPPAGYELRTLTLHQNAVVVAMIDLILPATDTPGAKAVRVNEFMDVILTDWATVDERERFLAGLDDVDTQANALFGKNFLDASVVQQTALLQVLDDSVDWAQALPREPVVSSGRRFNQLRGEFFRSFKLMTIHGYYTSEIGQTRELKREIIPGVFHGCAPAASEKKA
jgi:hypothetical protein